MNRILALLSIWILASIASLAHAVDPAVVRTQVFSGQDLSGWVVTGCEVAVENSLLVLKEGNGLVRTDGRYRDFILELDYKPRKAEMYDAGIYIRSELPAEGKPWPSQYQVNLKQSDELNLNKFPMARSSGLVKAGDWNHVKLTVIGDKATLEINGKPAWETDGIEAKEGYVGLQCEVPGGGQFEFKEIFITELDAKPIFDGQTLAGWEGAGEPAEKCWKADGGAIVCTGEKGPWLRSLEEFGDFNLRLEYKLKEGGNSGVYIRVPKNGNHHGDGAGVEIQVLDDKAERYKSLKPYQYTGSVYAVVPAGQHVGREAGQWNSLEINCRGTAYHVIHNGVMIVAADESSNPALKGRLARGFLGLQNHSEEVWFRNLRIGPAYELAVPPPVMPDVAQLKEILSKPILDPALPQREVETFCDARVRRLPADDAPERASSEAWLKYAEQVRQDVLKNVVFRGEAAKWRDAECKVEWLDEIEGGEGYKLKKLRYEALPGLWIPALLYEPAKLEGKVPVFLNVNGHDGAGKAAPYKQIRSINMAKRGMVVLNVEWLGMGQLRGPNFAHYKMNQLDLCGTSGLAPFYLAMSRGLDILLKHPNVDPARVGVSGLSGGGWQTIVISSLDTRVTMANPVAGYSSFLTRVANHADLGDSEQTPCDLAIHADYAHLTTLLAPRVALLTYNEKDNCCFAAPHALPPLLEAARPVYRLLGAADALHDHINYDPGTHNFERDNREALYKVIGAHWYSGDATFSPNEIESTAEVKTAEQLNVELPADNLDFQKLAERLMQDLPRSPAPPASSDEATKWQAAQREALSRLLRVGKDARAPLEYKVTAEVASRESAGPIEIVNWKLKIGDVWTIPAVELALGEPTSTAIVLADGGRAEAAEKIASLLAAGTRVVAVDPYYFGESKIKSRDFLFALLVSSVGERPLGVQSSQIGAIARWLEGDRKTGGVSLVAIGPRVSLIALTSAALEEKAIASITLDGSLASLKEVIEQGGAVNNTPEQFCFGLLEQTDIAQLLTLVAPRNVKFVKPSDRLTGQVTAVMDRYKLLFDPLSP
jgi:hypothetical protein